MEALVDSNVVEIVIVWVPGRFGQVVLEIIEPVAGIIARAGRCFNSDFLVGIVQETEETNIAIGRCRQIGILHCPKNRALGESR